VLCNSVKAHSGDEVVARCQDRWSATPDIDGIIDLGEWWDADTVAYQASGGGIGNLYMVTVYFKEDGGNLYIAFDIPDTTWMWAQDELVVEESDFSWVLLDLEHDDGTVPQTDDLALLVDRWGGQMEGHGNPSSSVYWESYIWATPNGWTAASFNNQEHGFQTEYCIPYSKIGITAGVAKTLGVAFVNEDSNFEMTWFSAWPPSEWGESDYEALGKPNVWGDLLFNMRYDLTVYVTTAGGPISGASVEVQMIPRYGTLPEGEPEYRFGVTDKDGYLVFPDLLSCDYVVTASAAGYRPTSQEFPPEWTLNENRTLILRLTQKTLESCDANGVEKNRFHTNEVIYVKGDGFPCPPDGPFIFDIYIVKDVNWSDGMAIPKRVLGTETQVLSVGDLVVTPVWSSPLAPGSYDIVIDLGRDGIYDAGYDHLDDNNINVTAGLFVIPEYWLGTILGLAGCFAALGAYRIRRRDRSDQS
jgi:hypothetical protein